VVIVITMFLVPSITMLRERLGGTLERLMSMPVSKLDLWAGYGLACGLIAAAQALINHRQRGPRDVTRAVRHSVASHGARQQPAKDCATQHSGPRNVLTPTLRTTSDEEDVPVEEKGVRDDGSLE
jgi:hypothetical protein